MKNFLKKKKKKTSPPTSPSPPNNDLDLETMLKRKQDYLISKEKELMELQKKLEKKKKELKKKPTAKAKADLRAAKKLNRARKKLMVAVDLKEKEEKQQKKEKKKRKKICNICDPTQCNWVDKIHAMITKLVNCHSCLFCNTKKQTISKLCEQYFKKLSASLEDGVGDYCTPSASGSPRKYSYFDKANDDCCEMAMAMSRMPRMCGFPAFPIYNSRPNPPAHCRKLKFFLLCLASFLFWSPCLLIVLLCKCFCCLCNSDC